MNTHFKSISLSFLLLSAAVLAQSGAAELDSTVPKVTVSYADLNLDEAAGAATLYARIAGAAARVCPGADSRNLAAQRTRNICMADAIQRAVATVSAPALTRYYQAKTGKSLDGAARLAAGR